MELLKNTGSNTSEYIVTTETKGLPPLLSPNSNKLIQANITIDVFIPKTAKEAMEYPKAHLNYHQV
jgi:hypothetical protein